MNRRDFFHTGGLAGLGLALWPGVGSNLKNIEFHNEVKNIIFLVTDGMSSGTFQMADLLRRRLDGKNSHWLQLYRDRRITRALMDMASANSSVPDSAAAASGWGCGVRVENGSLNMGPEGEIYRPIFQKFKAAGKSTGCVTTVPITHATPAGFLISNESRRNQAKIAELYLKEKFDVLLGGGHEYFDSAQREDGKDMYSLFRQAGYHIALNKDDLQKAGNGKKVLGVFHQGALPYTLDQINDR
nr:alkaline phosphatase [Saprospiraceae bacterium]